MNPMEESLHQPLKRILAVMQRRIVESSRYFGVPALKSPIDFWIYQEIVTEMRPEMIVEIGNHCGGSTLALAHLCDALGTGRVVGVDLSHERIAETVRRHPRITLVEGDACDRFEDVARLFPEGTGALVIEDSSHTYENTLNVLRAYSRLVPVGGYFIVEDGICHHGLEEGPRPGPMEAVEAFIAENARFEIDRGREPFVITWNPKGYLHRVA